MKGSGGNSIGSGAVYWTVRDDLVDCCAGYSSQSGSILQAALYAGRNIGEVTGKWKVTTVRK